MTLSRKILTAVALSVPLLSFAAPTATDLDGSFSLQSDPFVYESATVKHATVQGVLNDVNDVNHVTNVAWYSFTGQAGQRFWADHDDGINGDTLIDSVLSLFDANGQLLAQGDDIFGAVDPGSIDHDGAAPNAFVGVYALPSDGVYYLALSSANNVPDASGCTATAWTQQPGGDVYTGYQYTGCSINFAMIDNGASASGSFTLHVSLADTGPAVPEPGSLSLAGLALAGLMARRRRR